MQPTGETLNEPGGLAERLKRLRKVAGLTGVQLAAQLGWPRSKVLKRRRRCDDRDGASFGQSDNRKRPITANVGKRLPCRSAGEWPKGPQARGPSD